MKKFIYLYLLALLPIVFFNFKNETVTKSIITTPFKLAPIPSNQVAFGVYQINQVLCTSTNGLYSLIFQGDGNLVLYKNSTHTGLWCSGPIRGNMTLTCNFTIDGDVILNGQWGTYYDAKTYDTATNTTQNPWDPFSTPTYSPNCFWVLQDDGNLVRYHNDLSWSVSTSTDGGKKSSHFGTFEFHN